MGVGVWGDGGGAGQVGAKVCFVRCGLLCARETLGRGGNTARGVVCFVCVEDALHSTPRPARTRLVVHAGELGQPEVAQLRGGAGVAEGGRSMQAGWRARRGPEPEPEV